MPYLTLPTRARKDPLGPGYLNGLRRNLQWLRDLFAVEHQPATGEHNCLEVPRLTRHVDWSGAAYTESPAHDDFAAITNPAVGEAAIELKADRFSGVHTFAQVNVQDTGDEHVGLATYRLASATDLRIYLSQLTALAGNTWSAADRDFDIAVHSIPLARTAWGALPAQVARADGMHAPVDGHWNAHIKRAQDLQSMLGAEHTLWTGAHATRQVAKAAGWFSWNGTTYDVTQLGGITLSASRTAAGKIDVTYSAVVSPSSGFCTPEYARSYSGSPDDVFVANTVESSTTTTLVRLYKYDVTAKTWSRADTDFFFVLYAG